MLRPYQVEAVEQICKSFANGTRRALMIMPTGTGKSVVAREIVRHYMDSGRVMLIAHREELISQLASHVTAVTGEFPAIEKADMCSHEQSWCKPPVVVASIQTLISGRDKWRRVSRFKASEFSLVIYDEAHHVVSNSYRMVIDHFDKANGSSPHVLGMTATPNRHDERAMGQVFDGVAYEMGIQEAIGEGWLVRPLQQFIEIEGLDFSQCRKTAGDLNGRDLEQVLLYEKPLYGMAEATVREVGERPTILFAATVAHAERLAEIINRYKGGAPAVFVCGKTIAADRHERIQGFKNGKYQFLVNVGITTEGFDAPDTACIAMGRPTMSQSLYTQMLGRGTRPESGLVDNHHDSASDRLAAIENSGKPDLLVIDFVGNSGRHKLINSFDVLGGNYDEDIVELAIREARESGKPAEIQQGIDAAEHKAREDRRLAEEARRRHLRPTAAYSKRSVNPFEVLDVIPWRTRAFDIVQPASDKQVACLIKFGIAEKDAKAMPKREANQVIGTIIKRIKGGLCTYKQAKLLRSKGLPSDVPIEQAGEWITKIKANQWRLPNELRGLATTCQQ